MAWYIKKYLNDGFCLSLPISRDAGIVIINQGIDVFNIKTIKPIKNNNIADNISDDIKGPFSSNNKPNHIIVIIARNQLK